MSSLTNLNLSENAFESLPQLYRSPWIKQLKLDGNPLTTIPPHLATNHSDLLEYLKQFLEDNQVQWPRIRLVVLGRDGNLTFFHSEASFFFFLLLQKVICIGIESSLLCRFWQKYARYRTPESVTGSSKSNVIEDGIAVIIHCFFSSSFFFFYLMFR
jgi:hypothetical protein